jgi:quinoprotein glucose dehydrogenase
MSMPLQVCSSRFSVQCVRRILVALIFLCGLLLTRSVPAAEASATATRGQGVQPLPASGEAESAMKRFKIPPGWKVELFAAEPMLANPVAFSIDEQGRVFVAETYRHSAVGPAYRFYEGVFDIRSHMDWLEHDLAARTVEDRVALLRRNLGTNFSRLTEISEKIRLLEDRNHDGRADFTSVFAEGFNRAADGIGAGVLGYKGNVYYACIPDLWLLGATNSTGKATSRQSLHTGFGVHIAFLGHDLHGLRMGPDGRLYFSIGDRGLNVVTREGKPLVYPDQGTILRCELDGSNLEVFAHGLRNPQELAFDDYGNLFTGDNNSDGGDRARWVYVVEGGDSGWRIGYQTLSAPPRRGPWNAERLWHPQHEGQPAHIVPPVANLGYGPSGVTYYPGTGLSDQYKGRFFLADFRGGASSGIHSFDVHAKGASFELGAYEQFIWESLPTDVDFGVEGGIYFSDWVETWNKTGKGRIYHAFDPNADKNRIAQTKALLNTTLTNLAPEDLRALLAHPDQRVRLQAQFAFVSLGERGLSQLAALAVSNTNQLTALHAIWGLGQGLRKGSTNAQLTLLLAVRNADPELRAQAAKMLGEATISQAGPILQPLIADPEPRVRFFAAISLGRLKHRDAMSGLFKMLEENADADPYLRHAAVMGLTGIADREALRNAASHSSASVRLGATLALRRLEDPTIAAFLNDTNIQVVAEAARAINDLPIEPALPQLAALISKTFNDTTTKTNAARPTGVEAAISSVAVETGITTIPEQILLRAINANFRLGNEINAEALAQFAANPSNADNLRADALHALADWAKPSGRDRITGLWRPVPRRDPEPARMALKSRLGAMLASKSPALQIASIHVAQKLGMTRALESLLTLAKGSGDPSVRLEALKALSILDRSQLQDVLDPALNSNDSALQAEATRLQAEINPVAALKRVKQQLESNSINTERSAVQALAILPPGEADNLLSGLVDRLLQNQVAPELQLDVLDAAGKRSSREVLDRVQQFEAKRPKDDPLAAFTECLQGGNAAEGRRLFFERAEVFCSRCHQVNGEGGEAGPKLTGIGSRQSRSYVLESIVMPNNKIAEGWENVTISLRDGRSFAGKVVKETNDTIVVNNTEDGDVPLKKSAISTRNRALSGMPEEFRQILTKQELRDLVEFLATQK